MSIVFYYTPQSSATPVHWALEELGVPYEKIRVDLTKGDQKKPEFLSLNPNGKVPTLVIDGVPMFESLAMILLFGERFGVKKGLWPAAHDPARPQAITWSVWSYVTFLGALRRLFAATSPRLPKEQHNEAQAAAAQEELAGLLGILEEQLGSSPYLVGEVFTLVDLVNAAVIRFASSSGLDVSKRPHMTAWLERCTARPAFSAAWAA